MTVHQARLESILRQKSRETWLKEGDKNSKFFHISITVKRRRNRIMAIKNGKDWISEEEGIKNYFIENFNILF